MPCDGRMYADQVEGLKDLVSTSVQVLAYATFAESAESLLASTDGAFILAGTAYGGCLAMEVLARAPDRVRLPRRRGVSAARRLLIVALHDNHLTKEAIRVRAKKRPRPPPPYWQADRRYSAIEKRAGRRCGDLVVRSTRGLAPRMKRIAQIATIVQMLRITVKALISVFRSSTLRLVLSGLTANQCVVGCSVPLSNSSSIRHVVSASCFSSDTRATSAPTVSPRATAW